MTLLILTVIGVALAMFAMAIGVIVSKRCLRGSCGGPDLDGPHRDSLRCAGCPRRRRDSPTE